MTKPENSEAKNKLNKGQDENLHTFVNATTGETREATQREFKNTLRDQGFIEQEDAPETEDTTPVVPA